LSRLTSDRVITASSGVTSSRLSPLTVMVIGGAGGVIGGGGAMPAGGIGGGLPLAPIGGGSGGGGPAPRGVGVAGGGARRGRLVPPRSNRQEQPLPADGPEKYIKIGATH